MDSGVLSLVMLASLFFCLAVGQWTAFTLGSVGVLILLLSKGLIGLTSISSVVWNITSSYILISIPMFLLMGEIILRSGVSTKFYAGVVALLGRLPGGLLHANIASCAVFSAVSGSSVATAASVGTVAIPELRRAGYEPRAVLGSLAAGGTLGILIPPSIVLVLYGALVDESITQLFAAAVVPGLLMTLLFVIFIACYVAIKPSISPPPTAQLSDQIARKKAIIHLLPILALLLVVLGGIYGGITTPTEASAVGALGAIVLAAAYRRFTWAMFRESLIATVKTTCMVSMVIVGAQILSTALTFSGVSREVSEWVLDLGLSKWVFFAAVMLLYLVLGCFVDGLSMMYMTLPVLLPVIKAMGFDLVWFGVAMVIIIEVGQITPPVGLNLFTIHGISGGAKFSDVALGSAPYVVIMLFAIVILAIWPELALWLPSTLK
ncbi:MAG: Neu5Ac permease [Pseudomonadota bacterium]|jgi:tripartite ATP-independent transporter DctM subunit